MSDAPEGLDVVCVTVDTTALCELCDVGEVVVDVGTDDVEEVVDDGKLDVPEDVVWSKDEEELRMTGRDVVEMAGVSEEETGVGLLLALELDEIGAGLGLEELVGSDGDEVGDAGAGEEGVLVELLEDIVSGLPKTRFLGGL